RAERDFRADRRAAARFALELEPAVEVANALAHVDEAHASGIAGAAEDETDAIVGHDQANDFVGAQEPDANLLRLGVLCSVAQRFLRDAVERQRGSRREIPHLGVRLARDLNAARLAELSAIRGQGERKPRLLQGGGMQLVRELPDVRSDLYQLVLGAGHPGFRLRARWKLVGDGAEIHGHARELLEDAVVELAGDARPLLLLRLHQPFVQRRDLRLVPLQQAPPALESSDADAVGCPEQRDGGGDAESTEPEG